MYLARSFLGSSGQLSRCTAPPVMAKYSSGWFRLHNQHVGFARTFAPRTVSLPVAGLGDGLMDPAPDRPGENEVEAEAGAHLESGDEAADLGHAEGNWGECAGSSAPFWPGSSTRIAARKASASIARVMCRYQPCQLRTS